MTTFSVTKPFTRFVELKQMSIKHLARSSSNVDLEEAAKENCTISMTKGADFERWVAQASCSGDEAQVYLALEDDPVSGYRRSA